MGPAPPSFQCAGFRLGDVLSGTDLSGTDLGSSSMGLVGSSSVRLGQGPSPSRSDLNLAQTQVRRALGLMNSGPAPSQVRRVWGFCTGSEIRVSLRPTRRSSVWLQYTLQGIGSDPGPSSLGLVGSRSDRLGFVASGSGSGSGWLGSSVSGAAPAIRSDRVRLISGIDDHFGGLWIVLGRLLEEKCLRR